MNKQRDMITQAQLLDKAHQLGLAGVKTKIVQLPDKDNGMVAVHHATVTIRTQDGLCEFQGTGDASADNVGSMIRKHIIRMSETRAVVRALRWATNTGKAAREELGGDDEEPHPASMAPPIKAELSPDQVQAAFIAKAQPLLFELADHKSAAGDDLLAQYDYDLKQVPPDQYRIIYEALKAATTPVQPALSVAGAA